MIHFLSGLPRSGSTLLGALLSQHPKLCVTATNDLIELIVQARNNWVTCDGFKAQGLQEVQPRIKSALAGMMRGFYQDELKNGFSILDKNRGWPGYIGLIESILARKIKIVCPVRPITQIVASFERLMRNHPFTAPYGQGELYVQQQTIFGRAQVLLSNTGPIGLAGTRLLEAMDQGFWDRLLFVSYDRLIEDPVSTCIQIFAFLDLKPIQVDPTDIIVPDSSRDIDVWGLDLHKIQPQIHKSETKEDLLPKEVSQWIENNYAKLQKLAQIQ